MRIIDTNTNNIVDITIVDGNGIDFTADFYDAGTMEYNEELDAYYGDVEYMVDQLHDMINHEGDFLGDETDTSDYTYSVTEVNN